MPEPEYESVIEVGENSYISITDADDYFETRYGAEAWADLSDEDKDKLLITATQIIDNLRLKGRKYVYTQTLNFPRYIDYCSNGELQQAYFGSPGINDGSIPAGVEKATCEEAFALLNTEATKRKELQEQGVTSFSIGKLSESFSGKVSSLLSQKAKDLLKPWVAGKVKIR